jgi:hypothetical protein
MNIAFFFQTQQISDDPILFDEFKKQKIFFSYFQVDQKYYLFVYAQQSIDINFLYQSIDVIQELDSKQRKIRSLRGFFLYALEIIENGKDYEILETNLQPFFWRKVKNIIRQNKKAALQEFLFNTAEVNQDLAVGSIPYSDIKDKIQNLQNQVNSLQDRIRDLETTLENSKYALSGHLKPNIPIKTIQQVDSTLKGNRSPYLAENQVDSQVRELGQVDSEIDPENLSSNPKKAQNPQSERSEDQNFITLSKISEEEQIEIIKLGFQLQAEGKISLKKYYESTEEYSLFQLKGYNIKYETIRRTKLYQSLKA